MSTFGEGQKSGGEAWSPWERGAGANRGVGGLAGKVDRPERFRHFEPVGLGDAKHVSGQQYSCRSPFAPLVHRKRVPVLGRSNVCTDRGKPGSRYISMGKEFLCPLHRCGELVLC